MINSLLKPSPGISFKIILEISLFQYVVISQCILICCKFIPPRHLTQNFLVFFFWYFFGRGGGRQAISNEEQNPRGPCNTTIYRWCASVQHYWISSLVWKKNVQDRMFSIGIESSNKIAVEMVWCSIWKAKVPNNVKMFAWNACHNVLPACANLVNRRVLTHVLRMTWCMYYGFVKRHIEFGVAVKR